MSSKRTSRTSAPSPSTVRAAARAISQYAAPGIAATSCTWWSASHGNAPVPTSPCQAWRSGSSGSRTCSPSSGCTDDRAGTLCLVVLTVGPQQQPTVRPRRQWRVHQPAAGVKRREIHSGARVVQIGEEAAQPVRGRLVASQAGQGAGRHVEAALAVCSTARVSSGCGDSSAKTRWPSSQRRLHRGGEPDRLPQVAHPVVGVARRHRLAGRRASPSSTAPPVSSGVSSANASARSVQDRVDLR